MKISYQREMNHNYLVVTAEKSSGFEVEMMLQNHIKGLLHMHMTQLNDETFFCYDITSRQPLLRILESQLIRKKEIVSLMQGISSALVNMEPYLLSAEQILLKPECIYLQPDTFEVSLCFVPGSSQDFRISLRSVLQTMLEKVDHQDKESVIMMYGLYQESLKDNCSMEDLCQFLFEQDAKSKEEEQDPWKEEYHTVPVSKVADSAAVYGKPTRRSPTEWIRFLLKGPENTEKKELEDLFVETSLDRNDASENDSKVIFCETGSVAPEQEYRTVLLGHEESERMANCRRLSSMDSQNPDIPISYYPFIVGKQENLVDYLLDKASVSRLHIRIDREGDSYWITDLNSTNGTTVRGMMLTNNERLELYPGDQLMIADLPYMFL